MGVLGLNLRREFFHATPAEVRALLEESEVNLLEFVEAPEALEWNQSRNAQAGFAGAAP